MDVGVDGGAAELSGLRGLLVDEADADAAPREKDGWSEAGVLLEEVEGQVSSISISISTSGCCSSLLRSVCALTGATTAGLVEVPLPLSFAHAHRMQNSSMLRW